MKYKCKVCGREERTKKAIRKHIKEKHTEKHSQWYYTIGGIFGGLSIAYILIYVLTYLFAGFVSWLFGGYLPYGAVSSVVFMVAIIYAVFFVKVLTYGRDKHSESLKWFGIGGFGLVLGLFINWIVYLADEKSNGKKYFVFFLAWLITTLISFIIFMAQIPS